MTAIGRIFSGIATALSGVLASIGQFVKAIFEKTTIIDKVTKYQCQGVFTLKYPTEFSKSETVRDYSWYLSKSEALQGLKDYAYSKDKFTTSDPYNIYYFDEVFDNSTVVNGPLNDLAPLFYMALAVVIILFAYKIIRSSMWGD